MAHIAVAGDDILLLFHRGDHRILAIRLELGGIRILKTEDVTGVLDDHGLQTEAQAKCRQARLTSELQRADLAFDATDAETARNDDAIDIVERRFRAFPGFAQISRDPFDVDLGIIGEAARLDRLGDGQVGVRQVDVLADDRDVHLMLGVVDAFEQILPFGPIDIMERQPELTHDVSVQAFVKQDLRHVVDARCIHAIDHTFRVDIAHERNLVLDGLVERAVGTQHERIRGDAQLAQHHHGMLGRLGFQLMSGGNVRHQRNMHEHAVLRAEFAAHLSRSLKERLRFDITDGAADFRDDHIDIVRRLGTHTALDLIGDMRNHLHALAQILAGTLLAQHGLVNLTGGDIRLLAEEDIKEALVMADVEIGLGAVLGDVDLTVLEGVHCARVDIDIGIEFLLKNADSAAAQQAA